MNTACPKPTVSAASVPSNVEPAESGVSVLKRGTEGIMNIHEVQSKDANTAESILGRYET